MSKQRFILLLIIFSIGITYYWPLHAQEWSDEISLDLPGQGMTTTPNFDIDPNTGYLHIVTMKDPRGVLYTVMDEDGTILRQNSIVHAAEDMASGGIWNGAAIAVDSQGRPHVVYREYHYGDPPVFSSYYTYLDGSTWTSPLELSRKVKRGWMLRIDIDENDKIHILRGSMANDPNDPEGNLLVGPVKYFRLYNGLIEATTDDIFRYSADARVALNAAYNGEVHFLTSCSDYPAWGGPVWYWRSFDGGNSWDKSTVQNENARRANGSPDIFVDASGNVHIIYGSQQDWQINKWPSVRYTRFENNNELFDIPVTAEGEIEKRFDTPQGVGAVAASDDGEIVIVCFSEDFGGRLYTKESYDGGRNWTQKELIAEESCGSLGRNAQMISAVRDKFYLVYPTPSGVKVRIKAFSTNNPPDVNPGGPYTGKEGDTISFDASLTSDEENNILQYEWDFDNDGIYDLTTSAPFASHTYVDDYAGVMKLKVTDTENDDAVADAAVLIQNVPPIPDAGGPYQGNPGEVIQLSGSAIDPGDDQLNYSWDLDNNGSFETIGATAQKTFTTNGRQTIIFKVRDDDSGIGYDTTYVQISNEPPVISGIGNQTINEGESFTPINLYKSVSDADNEDSEIGWTFVGNSNLTISVQFDSLAYIAVADSEWNGSETIQFTATDPGQSSSTTQALFTVLPVNDPPNIASIRVPPINEGEEFEYIFLDTYLSDPDHPISEIVWSARDYSELSVLIDQRVAIVSPPDEDWSGIENVTFVATDAKGNGLSDEAVVEFIVNPINDPPKITGIPDQTVRYYEDFHPILLDTCVNDVDTPMEMIQWAYYGNSKFGVEISNNILSITKNDPNWIGTETIYFIASDGQYSDTAATNYTTLYHNNPPVTQGFFNQTINENGSFEPLYLDNMVTDPDHTDEELSWSYHGNYYLNVENQDNRIFQIAVADSEWAGSETITFVVSDPGGLKDSSYATYSVLPINDPPKLRNLPIVSFPEDSCYSIPGNILVNYLHDPDNPFDEIELTFDNSGDIKGSYDNISHTLTISSENDWYGEGSIDVIAQDKMFASSINTIRVKVTAKPDSPKEFTLLSPAFGTFYSQTPTSIEFIWEESIDPDEGSDVVYTFNLSRESDFKHIIDQYNNLSDTTLIHTLPDVVYPGIYYWQVIATDNDGYTTECDGIHAFNLENGIDVADGSEESVPEEFSLLPNYPNPFNPETHLTYHVPRSSHITLCVYNSLGQLIKTIVDENQNAGIYTVLWDGKNMHNTSVSSGIYLYRLISDEIVLTRKMLLLQ